MLLQPKLGRRGAGVGEVQVDVCRWLPTPAAKTASACWTACYCSISCGNNLTNSRASQTSFSPRSLKMMVFRAQATFLAVSHWLITTVARQCCLHAAMAVSQPVPSLHQHHDTNAGHMLVPPICAKVYTYIYVYSILPAITFLLTSVVMIARIQHILLVDAFLSA